MVLRQQYQSISQGEEKDSSIKVQRQGGKCEAVTANAITGSLD